MQKASRTALMIAAYRARASEREDAIIHDPWARQLASEEGFDIARTMDVSWPVGELYVAVRTAWLDAQVRRFCCFGPDRLQVVLLGAGLDTRAARLEAPGVRWFEVDAAASQDDKLERIRRIEGYPVDRARYVRCDFERDDFLDRLGRAGFQADRPALFIWEGVTYYLSEAAVRATLRRVAEGCHPASPVLFDFFGKRIVHGADLPEHNRRSRDRVARLGEPFRFGTNDILPLAFEEGFRSVSVCSFDEATLYFTGTYQRAREFRFQWLARVSVEPLELP